MTDTSPSHPTVLAGESGHVFTGAMKSLFGRRIRSKVAVICKSADCGVKHMVPVYFNLP